MQAKDWFPDMKVKDSAIYVMELDAITIKMEICMKESGNLIRDMVMEFSRINMVLTYITGNGSMTCIMDLVVLEIVKFNSKMKLSIIVISKFT